MRLGIKGRSEEREIENRQGYDEGKEGKAKKSRGEHERD